MLKTNKFLALLLISLFVFSGCNTGQKKQQESKDQSKTSAEFQQKKKELQQKANKELADINEKVKELNNKIKDEGTQLTENQNKAIENLQEKRQQVNQELHRIPSVTEEEWGDFKKGLEKDLEKTKKIIDDILDDF